METNEKQVSNNIKAQLKRHGLIMEDLAQKLGITRRTVVTIVNHPFRYKIDYLNKIAEVIGCNINDFFMQL